MAGEEVEGWEGEEGSFREMNTGCAMGLGALAVVGIIQKWGLEREIQRQNLAWLI